MLAAAPAALGCCRGCALCGGAVCVCPRMHALGPFFSLPPQVNKAAQAVSVRDLYGLWIILAGGIGVGLLIMIIQRSRRHYAKRRTTSSGGCELVCEGGPLPQERRAAHLFASVAATFRINSKRRRTAGATSNRKGAAQGRQADLASAASSAAEEASQHHVTAAPVHPADLESAGSGALEAVNGSHAAQAPPPPQQQPQQSPPEGQANAGRSGHMGRQSSLLAPESVYSAHQWKSLLRTKSSPRSS